MLAVARELEFEGAELLIDDLPDDLVGRHDVRCLLLLRAGISKGESRIKYEILASDVEMARSLGGAEVVVVQILPRLRQSLRER